MRKAIFPGTFDPITLGHIDVINRALNIFDEIVVAVLVNIKKTPIYSAQQRLKFIQKATRDLEGRVYAMLWEGLLVDLCDHLGIFNIIKGLRFTSDYEYETQMALVNRKLNPKIETLFLVSAPEFALVSSSMVREILYHGGRIDGFVPKQIVKDLTTWHKLKRN
ncbi:MAG: pantetheine-phosphate adenylyltransferase [Deltaproteobacteria bacterium]|nr:pantetheine-phosphate adenylyltransferase [Deltaproteobacteria bacterium]